MLPGRAFLLGFLQPVGAFSWFDTKEQPDFLVARPLGIRASSTSYGIHANLLRNRFDMPRPSPRPCWGRQRDSGPATSTGKPCQAIFFDTSGFIRSGSRKPWTSFAWRDTRQLPISPRPEATLR